MKSVTPKVLHPILGIPLISYVLQTVGSLHPKEVYVVVGYESELIKKGFDGKSIKFVNQQQQLGTGHAVIASRNFFKNYNGDILILNGDCPLIKSNTLKSFLKEHTRKNCSVSILTGVIENPKGYGRVIRNEDNSVVRVVEQRDCSQNQKRIKEINSGVYLVKSEFLWNALSKLNSKNAQKELYLPDIIDIAHRNKAKIGVKKLQNANEILGVNNRKELINAENIIKNEIVSVHMNRGVTIIDPKSTFISPSVKIGKDSTIYPNTYVYGESNIGKNCSIGPSVWIKDSNIGANSNIRMNCCIEEAVVKNNVQIGPFANLRPDRIKKI
jgi:bifunctional UDP-N-acetylglucosamine pyrophosphorylase/glucosamine-1-phosphate N-acetyltransferase